MADIKIIDLAGSEFFAEDESFMNDLSEDELAVSGSGLLGDLDDLLGNLLSNLSDLL